jgi:hypothetical protein
MSDYRQQYDRMMRWYDRFVAIDHGRSHDSSSDNYRDEVYAFFESCYHLKDWIKNDTAISPGVVQSVEGHVSSSRSLRLCADICNSLKHLQLTRPRSHENPVFGAKSVALDLGNSTAPSISIKYEVETTNGPEDAFQLATDCVLAWGGFLGANNLK